MTEVPTSSPPDASHQSRRIWKMLRPVSPAGVHSESNPNRAASCTSSRCWALDRPRRGSIPTPAFTASMLKESAQAPVCHPHSRVAEVEVKVEFGIFHEFERPAGVSEAEAFEHGFDVV